MASGQAARRQQRWKFLKLLKWFSLIVLVWGLLAWLGARALVVNEPLSSADVIVVLSGSSAYRERTQKAAELYRLGRAPLVLLTDDHTRGGWSTVQQRNPYFVERAADELIKADVPAEKIIIVPGLPSSTHDEALLVRNYALAQRLKSILVVTSPYHSRRALRSFRQSFADTGVTVGLEPAPISRLTPPAALWWLQLEGWKTVGIEYIKLVYYRVRYG